MELVTLALNTPEHKVMEPNVSQILVMKLKSFYSMGPAKIVHNLKSKVKMANNVFVINVGNYSKFFQTENANNASITVDHKITELSAAQMNAKIENNC